MSKRKVAKDGVGEKPPNNFVVQPCGKEKTITIDFIKEDHNIFK
jgi:hypothetical protein